VSIRIRGYIEPLSIAAKKQAPIIIESEAYKQVVSDLEMYVNGAILGRSFLIAGHRGAGKTTMLRQAVQEVESRVRSRGMQSGQTARPLYIPLHGPDLLKPPEKAVKKKSGAEEEENGESESDTAEDDEEEGVATAHDSPGAGTPNGGEKKPGNGAAPAPGAPLPPPPDIELAHFLDRITSGLYFAAAQEFSRCFRDHAYRVATSDAELADFLELAADLQVQLDRQPDLDRLRDYWARLDALDHGVLFDANREQGRGVAEVTALFSIGRAMRTFTGKSTGSQQTDSTGKRSASLSLVTLEGQSVFTPLMGLATGALIWNATPSDDPLLKAFTALLTGFGTVLALKVAATRSRSTTQTWKERFTRKDDDPGSLYRVLPALIERFQLVGLYPVFVVDELDKVPGLGEKINALLGYMKQFVTERAFFCFVTDRGFYQHANAQAMASAYSPLHTRFGDSIFVRYSPRDFHKYLEDLISVDERDLKPEEAALEREASVIMRYVLLSRSYRHPYDLRREIAKTNLLNRTADDLVNSLTLQREVALQIAVEVVFRGEALREYVRDAVYAQTALDALYYPARKWREGVGELNLNQHGLTTYLVERTGVAQEVTKPEQALEADRIVPPALQRTLLAQVERVMALLCDPPKLVEEANKINLPLPSNITKMLQSLSPMAELVS
jgi:hypothetical protein